MTNEVNSLSLLLAYSSDSESDNEIVGPRVSVKRCHEDDNNAPQKIQIQSNRLPVPALLQSRPENHENSEEHGGRIRSFPHERGNWSTYVYIPFESNDIINELIHEIINKSNNLIILQPIDNLHISLTKTVVIRHHWIDLFTKTISENITHITRFIILFDKLKIYCNEERTRTFIGLQIKSGFDSILHIVNIMDKCMTEFNLPKFYEDPSFHMSLVWCVGDYENVLNTIIDDLNKFVYEFIANNPQIYIHVNKLVCKTGNKFFNFNLNNTTVN